MLFFLCVLLVVVLFFVLFFSFVLGIVLVFFILVFDCICDMGIVCVVYCESFVFFLFYDVDKKFVGYVVDLCLCVVDKLCMDLKWFDLKV